MEEDIFEEVGEQIDDEPNWVFVTGEEPWKRNYGLMEGELPWPQDEVTASNSSQANGDTPFQAWTCL